MRGKDTKLGEGIGNKLGEGEGTKLGEGEGSKLGEPCPKVRLSRDRLPIEPSFSLSGLLRANVVRTNVASRKCRFTQMWLRAKVSQPF